MYSPREACEYAGTIVKSSEHEQDLALKPNYPLLYYNHASAPSIPFFSPTGDASRYSPLHIHPLYLQLQQDQVDPRWHLLLGMVEMERHESWMHTLDPTMQV